MSKVSCFQSKEPELYRVSNGKNPVKEAPFLFVYFVLKVKKVQPDMVVNKDLPYPTRKQRENKVHKFV